MVAPEDHIDCLHHANNVRKWGYMDSWANCRRELHQGRRVSEAGNDWGGRLGVHVRWGVTCWQVGTQCSPMRRAAPNEWESAPSHSQRFSHDSSFTQRIFPQYFKEEPDMSETKLLNENSNRFLMLPDKVISTFFYRLDTFSKYWFSIHTPWHILCLKGPFMSFPFFFNRPRKLWN